MFWKRPSTASSISQGQYAEQQAARWLKQQQLVLVKKNYRSPFGEIDLIMQDSRHLIFIEVRYRKHQQFGGGAESVTASKQQKIRKTAQHFLTRHTKLAEQACRFDVIAAQPAPGNATLCFTWIKNAF